MRKKDDGKGSLIAMILVGIFWVVLTILMRAPAFFTLFGAAIIFIAVVNHIRRNKAGRDFPEEPDILQANSAEPPTEERYCPYCGEPVQWDFSFCEQCGKKLS